uniref:PPM-type phosphatase domain-containing protein n=1 Tax=Steinernema glaseri TaxID=37863 RepID=A0A1I7ZNM5_9BILA
MRSVAGRVHAAHETRSAFFVFDGHGCLERRVAGTALQASVSDSIGSTYMFAYINVSKAMHKNQCLTGRGSARTSLPSLGSSKGR